MKTIIPFLLLILISACDKDETQVVVEEQVEVEEEEQAPAIQEFIIIGDTVKDNVQFTSFSPLISLVGDDFTELYDFHIDSDGLADFRLKIRSAYPLAGGWFNGCGVEIECLNSNAEVSLDPLYLDSTIIFPKQYALEDTLFQTAEWQNGEFLISANGDVPNDGCYGPGCPNQSYGMWFGTTEKYIGVRVNGAFPKLGWIKISLPSTNVDYGQILIIEQFGFIP